MQFNKTIQVISTMLRFRQMDLWLQLRTVRGLFTYGT